MSPTILKKILIAALLLKNCYLISRCNVKMATK